MKTNLKRILAVLLSLALVFSLGMVGLTANAEDAATDETYFVLADGTDCGWVNPGNEVKKGMTGQLECYDYANRVTPQFVKTGAHLWLGAKNYTEAGVIAADVKTVSVYLKNDMDTTLTYRLARSEDKNTHGKEYMYWNLSGGWAYLCDIYGYVLPVFVEGGWLTVPAGFEGHVIYDLSTFAAAEKLAVTEFTAMAFDIKNTAAMLKQAWYFSEIAVSYDDAKTLIDTHMTEGFLLSDGTNAYSEHTGVFAPIEKKDGAFSIGYTYTTEGKTKFDGNIKVPFAGWSSFDDCIGGLADAVGFSFRLNVTSDKEISISPCMNQQQNNLVGGTIYMFGSDGTFKVINAAEKENLAIKVSNFDGIVYVFPTQMETTWGSTTYEDWKAKGLSLITFYTWNGNLVEDGSISFGKFTYIYDQDAIVDNIYKNSSIILNDGSKIPSAEAAEGKVQYTPEIINTSETDGDAVQITTAYYTAEPGARPNGYVSFPVSGGVVAPEKIKTLSFRLKTPNFNGSLIGSTKGSTFSFDGQDNAMFRGNITLVNYDGTVTEIAKTDGTNSKIQTPSHFDGTVILDLTGDVIYHKSQLMTFEEYMALKNNKISSLYFWMDLRYKTYYEQRLVFDDFRLGYTDSASLADKLAYSDIYSKSYELNSGLGNWNHTAQSGNFVSGSAIATMGAGTQGSNTYAFKYLPLVYDETNDKTKKNDSDIGVKGSGGFAALPKDIDLKNATAISYWISVPELPEGGWYNLSLGIGPNGHQYTRDTVSATVYLVDEDGVLVKTFAQKENVATAIRINEPFTGRVFYVLDDNATVKDYTDGSWYGWSDYLDKEATPLNWLGHYVIRSSKDVNENYPFYLDDYRLHFDDPKYNDLMWAIEDEKYWAEYEEKMAALEAAEKAKVIWQPKEDLSNAMFNLTTEVTNEDGTTTTTPLFNKQYEDMGEYGAAIHYQRVEGLTMKAQDWWYNDESTLSNAELAEKEAIVMWMSIPKTSPGFKSELRINGSGCHAPNSHITVNTLTGEIKYSTDYVKSFALEAGFEGYVIFPLQNITVRKDWGSTEYQPWSEYVSAKGFSSYQFYYNEQTNLDWYQGEIKFVDDISALLTGLGATTVEGDLNYDQTADILDLIRLKKYNAGAIRQIAYQNLDVDTNGTLDAAADMIGMKKILLGVDHTAEEIIEHAKYGVHMFHSEIGDWDRSKAGKIANETDVLNTYITSDIYEIAKAKEQGGSVWIYAGKGNIIPTESYMKEKTELVERIKSNKLWNVVQGVFYEEPTSSDEDFIALTKFWSELTGKRQFVCLATNQISTEPNVARFQYITDIGYDNYAIGLDDVVDAETGEVTRRGHRTYVEQIRTYTGLTDAPLWFFPQVYGNKTVDEKIAALEMYETLIDETENFGGLMYYTWTSWSEDTPGLEELINTGEYDRVAEKIAAISEKIFAME